MLSADNYSSLLTNFRLSLPEIKTLEWRLSKDPELRQRYADTVREDIKKGQFITVEPHDLRSRTDREWSLPNHPVINLNTPRKMRRVINGAAKFNGTSSNHTLLVGPDQLQYLI